jgi:hypothetical protein
MSLVITKHLLTAGCFGLFAAVFRRRDIELL